MLNEPFFEATAGGVTSPLGFRAAGVEAAIKYAGRKDYALLVSDEPANAAAVFTTNQVAAAPVLLDRERIAAGHRIQAVAVNSGCANACTGPQGLVAARAMAKAAADALGIDEKRVLVCSTGVIGAPLPVERVEAGAKAAAAALSRDGGDDAARAIMTTDTVPKHAAVRMEIGGRTVTLGGMCKGSGMIDPHMATMLAFLATDAAVARDALDAALREAVDASFNRVVVDGDRSTNDTAILLANGASGAPEIDASHPDFPSFKAALRALCRELAKKMAMDGEGATKFVTVTVRGARNERDARLAARAIARSPLAKTSWFGCDPNWGRVIAAAGYSGAEVDDRLARISYGGIAAYDRGVLADKATLARLRQAMSGRAFDVLVDLGLGDGEDTVLTCDFSCDYVNINADYTT
ncbi:MAG: bifunctional glutamate N-acetyltransferase/amino-acid acetyltransferase ArgJ [Kiritimatiellia bacterium]|jgi:glutamate N-acetyltransferase/amino-acid N-acetyltransferase